jgi:hypothetical protein
MAPRLRMNDIQLKLMVSSVGCSLCYAECTTVILLNVILLSVSYYLGNLTEGDGSVQLTSFY